MGIIPVKLFLTWTCGSGAVMFKEKITDAQWTDDAQGTDNVQGTKTDHKSLLWAFGSGELTRGPESMKRSPDLLKMLK